MKRGKSQNYIQSSRNTMLYIVMGILAGVVVGAIVVYTYVIPSRMEQEVVQPARQATPERVAQVQPAQVEETEAQQPEMPSREEPGRAVELAVPSEEPSEVSGEVSVEEEVVVTPSPEEGQAEVDRREAGVKEEAVVTPPSAVTEAPVSEGQVEEEPVPEPTEAAQPAPVAEEVAAAGPEVQEGKEVVPPPAEEAGVPAAKPSVEVTAAGEVAPSEGPETQEVAGTPEGAAPEEIPGTEQVKPAAEVAALETTPVPEAAVQEVEVATIQEEKPYGLHVASYQSEEKAIKDASAWLERGYQAFVIPAEVPGKGLWYRVMVGRYATMREASEQGAKLKVERRLDYVQAMALPYVIEVSTFQTLTLAGFEEAKLRGSGYTSFIVPVKGEEGIRYRLYVGVFGDSEGAETVSQRLRAEGIENKVIGP